MIARYGGEEFVVVLPATDADTARSICERIVLAFRNTGHVIGSDHARVTISIGCATHSPQTSFNSAADFVKAADQALYTAKNARPKPFGALRIGRFPERSPAWVRSVFSPRLSHLAARLCPSST